MTNNRRNTHRQRSRAPSNIAWLGVLLLALLLLPSPTHAQDGEPRSPYAIGFSNVGVHELDDCKLGKGQLSGILYPLGKLSNNGPVAWLMEHEQCDTVYPNDGYPARLWLMQSTNGAIPPLEQHQVIGPIELGSKTEFIGAGDYDGNGVLDIAVCISQFEDTSFGGKGYDISTVAVFYGNSSYQYSLQDTVRLSNGYDAWLGAGRLISYDINNDGADELIIASSSGWEAGVGKIRQPNVVGFLGTPGKKWGRDGASNRRVWEWWNVPVVKPLNSFGYWERRDADCDGHQDLVLYTNTTLGGTGGLQVIYGTPDGGFPDTNAIETLDYQPILGARSVLSDVTGDGVPDLVVGCGERDVIEVFAGKPGQRLQELYGSGNDSADRANNRTPVRPWAHLQLPHAISDAWFQGTGAFNLGDVDGDGVDEIWGESFPYIFGYRGLDALDSLGDIIYRGEVHYAYRLRDLQVNGYPVIVFTNNSRIGYYRITETPFPGSFTSYALPHHVNFRCEHASQVVEAEPVATTSLQFHVQPNPANGHQQLLWQPQEGTAQITLHDAAGNLRWKTETPALSGAAIWQTDTVPSGTYTITLTINNIHATQSTSITH